MAAFAVAVILLPLFLGCISTGDGTFNRLSVSFRFCLFLLGASSRPSSTPPLSVVASTPAPPPSVVASTPPPSVAALPLTKRFAYSASFVIFKARANVA